MAPALVGGPLLAPTGAYQTTFTPSWPSGSGRTAGNLLVCWCVTGAVATGSPLPATPAGWTRAGYLTEADTQGGGYVAATAILYYKVAAGGDTAPSFTVGTNVWVGAGLAEFSDAGTTVDQIGSAGGAYVVRRRPITDHADSARRRRQLRRTRPVCRSAELQHPGRRRHHRRHHQQLRLPRRREHRRAVDVAAPLLGVWCHDRGLDRGQQLVLVRAHGVPQHPVVGGGACRLLQTGRVRRHPRPEVVETLGALDDYEIHQFDDTPTLGIQARMLVEQAYSYAAPTVQTGIASQVTKTSAILAATINAGGEATTWWVEYGTTDLYGQETYRLEAGILDRTRTVQAAVRRPPAGNELPLPDRRGEHQRHQLRR